MKQSNECIEMYLKKTYDSNPNIRKKIVRELCPCKIQKNIDSIWNKLFEMITDQDNNVRYNVVHTLCDGSPKEKEDLIISNLEKLWNDKDKKIRRKVRKALGNIIEQENGIFFKIYTFYILLHLM